MNDRSGDVLSKALIALYAVAAVALFLYSYTQVDLSLTLSRANVWQAIQKAFQYVGYYQRPISAAIYVALLVMWFSLYAVTLRMVAAGKIGAKAIWTIVFVVAAVAFSYPAFSYDLFNYMFDAKTILVYHKSPYSVIPYQFTGIDPYLSFLHWTHVSSVYPPFWLAISLVPYLFGLGYFLTIMWSFKLLMAGAYLLTAWAIGRGLSTEKGAKPLLAVAVYALNPLVVYESLVSGHNDTVMMAFAAVAFMLYRTRKPYATWLSLAMSVGIKLMTIALLPVHIMRWNRRLALLAMAAILTIFLYATHREIMPWYMLWLMPFVALLAEYRAITILAAGFSFGLLMRYAPFLYLGNWDPPVPQLKFWFTLIPVVVSAILALVVSAPGREKAA